ncbi:putative phage abortive infection protein [Falsirhodobacter algicola]|uniref:Uncharacterized protein n=1 Tax=Falsirhodobacter algicola TaxID=2692330 RepID=A0A8J8SMF7_9RHOB|nr:putative phage abortive infection protein [Falsirhodobacter algicola]QUS37422.1 hypothetical protein GR316_13665 [Falsirhodobacter algicola]
MEYFASELPDELMQDGSVSLTVEMQLMHYLELYDLLFESSLGPYFRLMYNCVRQIEFLEADDNEREVYSKILRAQLSSAEVKLLMFNCSTNWGMDFKWWVEKHELLKHLPKDDQRRNPSLASEYDHLRSRGGAI